MHTASLTEADHKCRKHDSICCKAHKLQPDAGHILLVSNVVGNIAFMRLTAAQTHPKQRTT